MVNRHIFFACFACFFLFSAFFGCNRAGQEGQAPTASINQPKSPANTSGGETETGVNQSPDSDPRYPELLVETSLGNFTIRLDGVKSPLATDNFLNYVDSGHYDQTIVHQVYEGQGIVAGGFGTNYIEKPARTPIRNEAHNGLKNLRGTISMVRYPDAIDSATCQFFINVSDNPALDHQARTPEGYGYCVFGEVIEGMDVVDRINAVEVQDTAELERTPVTPIVIKSIRRIR